MIFTRQWLEDFLDLSDISDGQILSCLNTFGVEAEPQGDGCFSATLPDGRADLHSVVGIARILAAGLQRSLRIPEISLPESDCGSIFEHLDVDTPSESCLRFSARMAMHCRICPSPEWLQQRLLSVGIPPQNNLRDIAAFVLLETGIPVRMVDAEDLPQGSLMIRDAFPGETFTVNGEEISMNGWEPVLSDENYTAISPAGVMGTELSRDCDIVYIFCGIYDREIMMSLSGKFQNSGDILKQHCLGLDPMATLPALDRACELLQSLAGAEIADGTIDNLNYVPQPGFLPVPEDLDEKILQGLGTLGFCPNDGMLEIPSFRRDVLTSQDLFMEISRLKSAFSLF